jgi:hypothetical protein
MLHQKSDCVEDFPRREAAGYICPSCGRRARWVYLVAHDGSLPDGACRACLDLTYRSRQQSGSVRASLDQDGAACAAARNELARLLETYKTLKDAPVPRRIERQGTEAIRKWRWRQHRKSERAWNRWFALFNVLPPQRFSGDAATK